MSTAIPPITIPAVATPFTAAAAFPPVTPAGLKDVGITYILLIFFGAIGVHKFYLGKVGLGIAYIFTLGFCGIGTLVDIFTLSTQVRTSNAKISTRGF